MGFSPECFKKQHSTGKLLTHGEKQMALNVYAHMREQFPRKPLAEIYEMTANATGIGKRSLMNVKQEFLRSDGKVCTPKRKRPRGEGIRRRLVKYDAFVLTAVRSCVHSFFRRNEAPTVKKITDELHEADDEMLRGLTQRTVLRLLKDLGFERKAQERESLLIEKDEIVAWRQRYLRMIRRYRREQRHIVYLDETWVNSGHRKKIVWKDTTIKSARQAFIEGQTVGLKPSSGKGKRLIITHAGSTNGWVSDCLDVFCGNKHGDYHEEMDSQRFERWFSSLLLNVPEGTVIILDNAPYHSKRVEAIPTQASRKGEIRDWLSSKGIAWEEDMLKAELLHIVAQEKHRYIRYRVDKMAEDAGCVVLRLPPYHCELNPIELIWAQVKNEVAAKNTTSKLADVRRLLEAAVQNVTPENWRKACAHVERLEEKFREADMVQEDIPPVIIRLGEDDELSDGSISGIEALD